MLVFTRTPPPTCKDLLKKLPIHTKIRIKSINFSRMIHEFCFEGL